MTLASVASRLRWQPGTRAGGALSVSPALHGRPPKSSSGAHRPPIRRELADRPSEKNTKTEFAKGNSIVALAQPSLRRPITPERCWCGELTIARN